MKKIVFVAYHPSMLTNWVEKLAPYLQGYDISVLHISKLHGIKLKNSENIKLYDISYYSYSQNRELLKSLQANLVVFFSFRSLWEHTLQRICITCNICNVFLEHGLFTQDTLHFRKQKIKREILQTFKRQFLFLRNEISHIIKSSNIQQEWEIFKNFYFKNTFNYSPFDHYFIYSQRSFDMYSKIFNLSLNKNTTLIGYPIFNDEQQKHIAIYQNTNDSVNALYVHQPLISDGYASISYEEEKEWLMKIRNTLKNKYPEFTILLHPRANIDHYKKRFNDTDIKIVQSPNNFSIFKASSLIIGHYSTALLYGLYFDKPTVILNYPSTQLDILYVECFNYCKNINKLKDMNFNIKPKAKKYFVGDYNTYEHIADVLKKYIS